MLSNHLQYIIRGVAFCDCLAGWSLDARTGSCHRDRLPCPAPEEGVWLGGSCHAHPCGPGMTLWGEEGEGAGEGACLPLDSDPAFTTCTQERAGVLAEEVSLGSVCTQNSHCHVLSHFHTCTLGFIVSQ